MEMLQTAEQGVDAVFGSHGEGFHPPIHIAVSLGDILELDSNHDDLVAESAQEAVQPWHVTEPPNDKVFHRINRCFLSVTPLLRKTAGVSIRK